MKELHKFLKVFIFVQLGACSGRLLAKYIDYVKHPQIYAMRSIPWYYDMLVSLALTAIIVSVTLIAYILVGKVIKKRGLNKDNTDDNT